MGGPFAHIERCLELQETDLTEAIGQRDTTLALLAHLASISKANTGVAKVLIAYARLATTACNWIDGDLCIELTDAGDATIIEAATELGGGLRERIFAPFTFHAPIDEFLRAIERVPHMIVPLVMRAKSSKRISLSASAIRRRTTVPPPPIEISSESLFVRVPAAAAVPKIATEPVPSRPLGADDVDGGWEG